MFAVIAGVLFAVFVGNVAIGASGAERYLTDVQEMIVLFAASCAFVIVVLKQEAKANASAEKT